MIEIKAITTVNLITYFNLKKDKYKTVKVNDRVTLKVNNKSKIYR